MQTPGVDFVFEAGDNVSGIRLLSAADTRTRALVSGRGPAVIVILPSGSDAATTEAYLRDQAAGAGHLAEWGARLVVVVGGSVREAEAMLPPDVTRQVEVLADPWRKLGVGRPAALVIDEWGEIFFARQVELVEQLPSATELREWAVFVAIQCPECEGPEGAWKQVW